eukprot:1375404-Amorphochlora_amoeboformis.AAC.1
MDGGGNSIPSTTARPFAPWLRDRYRDSHPEIVGNYLKKKARIPDGTMLGGVHGAPCHSPSGVHEYGLLDAGEDDACSREVRGKSWMGDQNYGEGWGKEYQEFRKLNEHIKDMHGGHNYIIFRSVILSICYKQAQTYA